MKLLIILAILTLGRGADVEQSDEILKELESLVASDQTTKNDEKKLELESDDKLSKEVLNKILSELEDEPVKSDDDDDDDDDAKLPSDDESLMDDIVTYTLERRGLKKKYNGDEVCFDRLRSCQRREGRCKNRRWKSTLRRLCSFTCGFCTPKDCRVSKYGCCNKYSKTAADGPKKEGCALKECYDVGKCDPSKCASYGEVLGKKFCPKTCGFCQRKQPAQPKCTDRGWGCCERHPNQAASGPKLGCKHVDKVRILDENYKVPPATCKNIGHGCCRTDGSVTARGPKRGCDICANTDETVCDRFRAYQKICLNPSSRHRSTYESLRRWCPRLCGVCIRS